ncbi:MAG TPA: cupredoxin domain-containing protein [Actinomycetota bacterium]|nr:cupredoxin domain-containing protein [Actinomycetota bacterium]
MTDTDQLAGLGNAPSRRAKARWSRLAVMGLVMAAVGPLLMFGAGLIWGLDVSEDATFFIITAAIALLGAFLVSRSGAWFKIAGVVTALLVAVALFWTAFGLAEPASFFDFVPGLLVMPGAFIAIGASIAAFRAARRGDETVATGDGEQRFMRVVLTAVAVLAAVSGILTFTSKESVAEEDADTVVTLSDFEFDEASYSFPGGSTVLVRNDDPFLHTFTIEALDIDEKLTPGSEVLVEIPSESGDYIVFCRPHTFDAEDPSEDDMAADVTID